MNEIRQKTINNYIEKNGYPNAKIIHFKDPLYFDFYDVNHIPKGLALADSVVLDEYGHLRYGFVKGFDGEEMRLITGYTGSGKSMRYLLQQLMVAVKKGQSAVVTDMSGQLIEYAYDFLLKEKINVLVLNFANTKKSDTFNPFYTEAKKCAEAKKILVSADQLMDSISNVIIHSKCEKDESWQMGAKSLLKGIMLGLFEELIDGIIQPEDITLNNVIQQFFWLRGETEKQGSIARLKDVDYYCKKDKTSRSMQLILPIAECAPVTRSGFYGVLCSNLSEINNEFMFDITSSNTINLSDLWEKQTVLFINTGGKTAGDVVTSMLVNQLYLDAMEASSKNLNKKLPRPIQLFLDEFANISFGDNKHFEKMLTTTRKMQIFFNMFIQNYTQIRTKFGEDGASTITSNSTEIFLGTKDYESRREFANSCGQRTIESIESVYQGGEPKLNFVNLISPEELLKMPKGTMYIVRNGYDMIKTQFEAVYNCKDFIPSNSFENDYTDKRSDYVEKTVLQPMMVKKLNLKKIDFDTLSDVLSAEEMDLYMSLYDSKTLKHEDKISIKKFERLGIVERRRGSYKPLITKAKFEQIENEQIQKHKKFDWDF